MALFREHADVSVRPATPEDESAITRVQLRSWRASHAEVLGALLEDVDVAAVRDRWTDALTSPPSPAHRVLVACAGARVVGFAASVPLPPDGVDVVALEVDPDHQRGGHGSRLLTACVDLARQDGAQHLSTWVLEGDPARERFLAASGLGRAGDHRELALPPRPGGAPVTAVEHRWVAEI